MDKRLLTVVLAAVLVALIITAIFYQITVGRRSVEADMAMAELVVAKHELPMGSVITADDLRIIDFPQQAYPRGGFSTIEDVVERSVIQPILSDEPVTQPRVTEKGAGFGLAPLIPDGYRAVAVAINQVSGVSGFILPGSKVDILLTGSPQGSESRLTTTVLENVTVLSTGHRQQPDANGQPQNVPTVNMLLTPEQAELVTLATQEGRIHLVLRNPKDEKTNEGRRSSKTVADLYPGRAPEPPRRARPAAPRVVRMEPPPPAPRIEMIRGTKRSIEILEQGLAGAIN